ncbi:sodium:calcium antiporter [Vulcanisaeta thermophila]|uniref:sodium:calcium antiporter n=1 Tax=Vulcanisaeta thermophila TaxID=867917 RepID=UPI000B0DED16|nr:sodium:calcium antiporter [Vulcanisaeta thermophila]
MPANEVINVITGILTTFLGGLLFTNAVEYLGGRVRLGGSFIGAVVSPIFTSMPELVVFLVALYLYGGSVGEEIGIGTVIGEPFMVATIVFPVLFLVVFLGLVMRTRDDAVLEVERELVTPYIFFTALFPTVLLPALLPMDVARLIVALLLFAAYVYYISRMYRSQGSLIEEYDEAYLLRLVKARSDRLTYLLLSTQLAVSAVLLIMGSRLMVTGVGELAEALNVSAMAMSIIITPIATVIPESITAIIWTFRGRDTLAVASLVGEKVLYSTVYPALGLLLTEWSLSMEAIVSVVEVEVSSLVILYHVIRGRLTWDTAIIGLTGYIIYLLITTHVL